MKQTDEGTYEETNKATNWIWCWTRIFTLYFIYQSNLFRWYKVKISFYPEFKNDWMISNNINRDIKISQNLWWLFQCQIDKKFHFISISSAFWCFQRFLKQGAHTNVAEGPRNNSYAPEKYFIKWIIVTINRIL